jgi:hypothetical protein
MCVLQLQQVSTPEPAARAWKSPSPQPERWGAAPGAGFVLHDRTNQPFPVHYNDRYHNGNDAARDNLSYTVINSNQYASQTPPLGII